jgi:hypothetical protein
MKSKPVRFIEDSMTHETELLYVVILVIFILVIDLIMSRTAARRKGNSPS